MTSFRAPEGCFAHSGVLISGNSAWTMDPQGYVSKRRLPADVVDVFGYGAVTHGISYQLALLPGLTGWHDEAVKLFETQPTLCSEYAIYKGVKYDFNGHVYNGPLDVNMSIKIKKPMCIDRIGLKVFVLADGTCVVVWNGHMRKFTRCRLPATILLHSSGGDPTVCIGMCTRAYLEWEDGCGPSRYCFTNWMDGSPCGDGDASILYNGNGWTIRTRGERWITSDVCCIPRPSCGPCFMPTSATTAELDEARLPLELHDIIGRYAGYAYERRELDGYKCIHRNGLDYIYKDHQLTVTHSSVVNRKRATATSACWNVFENHVVVADNGCAHVFDADNGMLVTRYPMDVQADDRVVCGDSSFRVGDNQFRSYVHGRLSWPKHTPGHTHSMNIGIWHYDEYGVESPMCAMCQNTCISIGDIHANVPAFGKCAVITGTIGTRSPLILIGDSGVHVQIYDGDMCIANFTDRSHPIRDTSEIQIAFFGDGVSIEVSTGHWVSYSFFLGGLAPLGPAERS
jgi:hypothetical protein